MSLDTLRQFVDRHTASYAGLCAVTAQLDARASGAPLPPTLDARTQDLLSALGGGDVFDNVTADDARGMLVELRHFLVAQGNLLYADTRSAAWSFDDARFLEDTGDFARRHAMMLDRMLIPAVPGLAERMGAPGATFLDVGVGVAGLAIQLAQVRPGLRIVGVDVFPPSLRLARENVAKAGLGARIELREQGFETLTEEGVYDLAWVPMPFIPERFIAPGCERVARALKPGGTLVMVFLDAQGFDAVAAAQWRLTQAIFGGPEVTSAQVEQLCKDKGLVDVQKLPSPPGVPAAIVVARRKS